MYMHSSPLFRNSKHNIKHFNSQILKRGSHSVFGFRTGLLCFLNLFVRCFFLFVCLFAFAHFLRSLAEQVLSNKLNGMEWFRARFDIGKINDLPIKIAPAREMCIYNAIIQKHLIDYRKQFVCKMAKP